MKLFVCVLSVFFFMLSSQAGDHKVGSLIDDQLVDMNGKKVKASLSSKKYVIFYYSAAWCGPCQRFTPQLVQFYNDNKDADFELVFVSSDKSSKAMMSYMKSKKMSFPALDFKQARNKKIRSFSGKGIPFLAMVDAEGKAVVRDVGGKGLSKIKKILGK